VSHRDQRPPDASDIVFFDGDCLFCQARVRWLRAHDREAQLAFAPLQGELAGRLLAGTGLLGRAGDGGGGDLSTMVLVSGAGSAAPEVFIKSRAVAAVAARLPSPWRLGGLLALVPRPLADAAYDWVARRRHRWARGEACPLEPDVGGVGVGGDRAA
jgi:predicted DCC family thiol-disulfide oxidoreductase YuxK